jgi:hypothetical protein
MIPQFPSFSQQLLKNHPPIFTKFLIVIISFSKARLTFRNLSASADTYRQELGQPTEGIGAKLPQKPKSKRFLLIFTLAVNVWITAS